MKNQIKDKGGPTKYYILWPFLGQVEWIFLWLLLKINFKNCLKCCTWVRCKSESYFLSSSPMKLIKKNCLSIYGGSKQDIYRISSTSLFVSLIFVNVNLLSSDEEKEDQAFETLLDEWIWAFGLVSKVFSSLDVYVRKLLQFLQQSYWRKRTRVCPEIEHPLTAVSVDSHGAHILVKQGVSHEKLPSGVLCRVVKAWEQPVSCQRIQKRL